MALEDQNFIAGESRCSHVGNLVVPVAIELDVVAYLDIPRPIVLAKVPGGFVGALARAVGL
ncbi:hypothetical protein [Streptomyces sp. NPDC088400]|uniref:hypothetical protein n=1 Tax=Streptomyces sp. NPDC088400 TaxID=3365861 RepID=UPI0038261CD8